MTRARIDHGSQDPAARRRIVDGRPRPVLHREPRHRGGARGGGGSGTGRRRCRRQGCPRGVRGPALEGHGPAPARRSAVAARRPGGGEPRGDRRPRDGGQRKAAVRVREGRPAVRGGEFPLLRGIRRQDRWRGDPRVRAVPQLHATGAPRRRRRHRPLELPAQPRLLEARSGARLREHGRSQARRGDPPASST